MKKFEVLEDNGGGLTLFVFDENGKVEYAHTGFEYIPGELKNCIEELKNDANPIEEWDNNMDDFENVYDSFTEEERENGGWELVADNDGFYYEKMGASAKIEFEL